MLKYVNSDVTFREVPDEVSLCINLSCCPHHCKGCHSPELQTNTGVELTETLLCKLIEDNKGITCVCFMGGDNDIPTLFRLANFVVDNYKLKTAWYTGLSFIPKTSRPYNVFEYIKVGPYIEERGPLDKKTTNQILFKKMPGTMGIYYSITNRFWKNEKSKDIESVS